MKLKQIWMWMATALTALAVGCATPDEEVGLDDGYGYVQFKLYKKASYVAPEDSTKAIVKQLERLADAYKVKVTLEYGNTTIAQTLTLSSGEGEAAEWGLRSDKLKLLTGDYRLITFSLYDAEDNPIYNGTPEGDSSFTVISGGMIVHDITVDVVALPYAWGMLGILAFMIILFTEMMIDHVKIRLEMLGLCLLAGLLLPYMLSALVRMEIQRMGNFWVIIPLILAFLPDSGAYFAGTFFGRHKLAPVISPKKTVEGVIGGLIVAVVGMLIYGVVVQLFCAREVNYLYALIYGLAGTVVAVVGDLCFSAIKRQTGIKDYGNLIPGHGGILDRFDSMILVAPMVEALLELIPVVVS